MALPRTLIYRFLGGTPDELHARLVRAGVWDEARDRSQLEEALASLSEAGDDRQRRGRGARGPSALDRVARAVRPFLSEAGQELARTRTNADLEALSPAAKAALETLAG